MRSSSHRFIGFIILLSTGISLASAQRLGSKISRRNPALVVQLGHSDPITSISFSSDGRRILTGGEDTTAQLWDVETGQQIRTFRGQQDAIWATAISPDGSKVLTGSFGHTARIWDARTGQESRRLEGHRDTVYAVAFSPDGRWVLTGSDTARLWDLNTKRVVRRFDGHFGSVLAVAFSPNGRFVATGGADKTMRLWNVLNGKEIGREQHSGSIWSVAVSHDGHLIGMGGEDKTACFWEVATKKTLGCTEKHPGTITSISFSPNGKFLVTGNDDKARIFEVATRKEIMSLVADAGKLSAVAYSPDGRTISTSGPKNAALLWDATTGRLIRTFKGYSSRVSSVAFSPDGRRIAIGREDSISVWDAVRWKEVQRFTGEMGAVRSVAFSADGRTLAVGCFDFTARLWNIDTGEELQRFDGHSGAVNSVAFSPDGRFLATGSIDGTVRLWDIKRGAEIRQFDEHTDSVWSVSFSPDGRSILVGSNTALLWSVESGLVIQRFPIGFEPVRSVAFSPDGNKVLTAGSGISLWDVATGREIRHFEGPEGNEVYCSSFSPSGDSFLTGNFDDESIQVWDVKTGRATGKLIGHAGPILSATYSPDGKLILSGSWDGTARLWNWVDGKRKELCEIISLNDNNWIITAPDGRFDTGSLEYLNGLNWAMPDEPFKPLPLEIFMRDYYQPNLLSMLRTSPAKNGSSSTQMRNVRSIETLNRVQPIVRVVNVEEERNPGSVSVTVEVKPSRHSIIRNGKRLSQSSGAYDLRLFRDSQLVAEWPAIEKEKGRQALVKGYADLVSWRREHKIEVDSQTRSWRHVFQGVRLPLRPADNKIDFTAYAFNEDRVKSATSETLSYPVKASQQPHGLHAYVITIGVNANRLDSTWNLDFAVNSANEIKNDVVQRLSSKYQVVAISLLSELEPKSPRLALDGAKREDFKAVFDLLAGHRVDEQLRREVDPKSQIKQLMPDDLVFVFISSHGYADPLGNFYIVPSDTGEPLGVTEDTLNKCLYNSKRSEECNNARSFLGHLISSDDLMRWWEDLDAGEMVMILDSCHSASVQGRQFRPGPFGDRGFGQLSYDKGMLILAATQSDKTARATLLAGTGRSILTDALLSIRTPQTRLDLSEWLRKTERQVPIRFRELYPQVKEDDVQYPSIFDFSNKRSGPISEIPVQPN